MYQKSTKNFRLFQTETRTRMAYKVLRCFEVSLFEHEKPKCKLPFYIYKNYTLKKLPPPLFKSSSDLYDNELSM